jgi:hypothetical protein
MAGPKDVDVQPEGTTCFCASNHLNQTELEGNTFMKLILRHWYTTSLQNQRHPVWNGATKDLHYPKNLRHSRQLASYGGCFQGFRRSNHDDFLSPCATIYVQYYRNLLLNDVHAAISKRRPTKL